MSTCEGPLAPAPPFPRLSRLPSSALDSERSSVEDHVSCALFARPPIMPSPYCWCLATLAFRIRWDTTGTLHSSRQSWTTLRDYTAQAHLLLPVPSRSFSPYTTATGHDSKHALQMRRCFCDQLLNLTAIQNLPFAAGLLAIATNLTRMASAVQRARCLCAL